MEDTITVPPPTSHRSIFATPLCSLHGCWPGLANFTSFCHPKLSKGKLCGFLSCHSLLVPRPQSVSNDKSSATHSLIFIAQEWRLASLQRGAQQYQMRIGNQALQCWGLSVNFCHPAQAHSVSSTTCGDCHHHTCGELPSLRGAEPLPVRFADNAQGS